MGRTEGTGRTVGLAVDGDTTGRDIRVIKRSGKVQALKDAIQSKDGRTNRG